MDISFDVTIGDELKDDFEVPFWIGNAARYGLLFVSSLKGFLFEFRTDDNVHWPYTGTSGYYDGIIPQIGTTYAIRAIIRNSDGIYRFLIDDILRISLQKPNTTLPNDPQNIYIGPDHTAHGTGNHEISNIVIKPCIDTIAPSTAPSTGIYLYENSFFTEVFFE